MATMIARSAGSTLRYPRVNALNMIQQRGARATLPLRRYMQQQLHQASPGTSSSVTASATEGIAASVKAVAAETFRARRPVAAYRVRVTRHYRPKSAVPKQPAPPKDPKAAEIAAGLERTHAANSRLSLSRNALTLRFSNENSYLNWARNGVLSSAVGVAMYAQEHHRGAQLSGAGLLLLGFGYIGVGTAKYIYYILRFRQVMELSWYSVIGTSSHASAALMIWLTATASFLESVPLELDAMLLTEPIIDFLPFRIRQGLIETYSLYLDDLEHHTDEQERVLRAIRGESYEPRPTAIPVVPPVVTQPVVTPPILDTPN